jgi:eukaryotic-like serine/threonine-protein kinase
MNLPARYTPKGKAIKGGLGQTIHCRDHELARDVIIKEIINPADMHRIIDEVVALQDARSKHVVEIYDVIISTSGSDIAIVEEYLPGVDLGSFKFDAKDPSKLYRTLFQAARGLADIHVSNVVHRDIKPNNMKFDGEGYLKIFDFGLAKVAPLPGSTAVLSATPGYAAPELFSFPPVIDKPVDVYAFGAMVFVLVTGALPPCAKPWPNAPVALGAGHSIDSLGLANPRIAPLIDACLGLDPKSRPKIVELRRAFERELLFGKHKATLTSSTSTLVLDSVGKKVKAQHGPAAIEIQYDGFDFKVTSLVGDIYINNRAATVGDAIEGSNVLTLGSVGSRLFVTFDVSHPEVSV